MPDLATILSINSGDAPPPTMPSTSDTQMVDPDSGFDARGRLVVTIRPNGKSAPPIVAGPDQSTAGPSEDASASPNAGRASQRIADMQATLAGPKGNTSPQLGTQPLGARSDIISNVAAGANESIAGALGAPVDLANAGIGLVERGINRVAGTNIQPPQEPFMGSEFIKRNIIQPIAGVNPNDVTADTSGARIARGLGTGAGAVLAPMGVAGAIERGAIAAPRLVRSIASSLVSETTGGALGVSASGATAGAAGQAAQEIAPPEYVTYANLGGQILGGLVAGGVGAGVNAATRTFGALADRFTAPMNFRGPQETVGALPNGENLTATAPQQLLARQRLLASASNPQGLASSLAPEGETILPGSQPTTGQASGNLGIMALERAQAAKHPDLFTQRRADQTKARWDALDQLRPDNADAFDAREHLGQSLEDMRASHAAQLSAIHDSAAQSLDGLRDGDPFAARDFLESQLREMDAREGVASAAARAKAMESREKFGGKLQPNEYGEAIRSELVEGRKTTKEIENRAWDAIDPEKKALIDAAPISQGAEQITSEMPRLSKQMSGDEKSIFDDAASLTGPEKFREVTALRSRITDALQGELRSNGRSETYRRLSMLLGKVDDTILGAVERQAVAEAKAGIALNADSVESRLQGWADEFFARRNQAESGVGGTSNDSGLGAGSSGAVSSTVNRPSTTGGRSGNAAGVEGGISGNVDEGLAGRYATARGITKQRASTFDEGPVGQALAAGKNHGGYSKADSQVAQTFFHPGPKSFDDVQAYLKAVGGRPDAVALGRDYLASDFLRAARSEDGTINPTKVQSWLDKHQDALRHFPELKEQFADAAEASRTVETVAAEHAAERQAFEDSAARHFIGTDPDKAIARVMSSADPAGALAELLRLTKGSPEATQSIRSNLVRHLTQNDGRDLAKSLADPKTLRAINQALRPDQVDVLRGIAKAYDQANGLTAEHAAAVKAFEQGPAKHFKDTDPKASITRVMGSKDPAGAMADLFTLTESSPAAQDAIRAAVADWIKDKVQLTAEVGASGIKEISNRGLQDIISDPKIMRALRQSLSTDQIKTLQSVAADTLRANRSVSGVKLPGGSNTAQDTHALGKHGGPTMLTQVIAAEVGGEILSHIGGLKLKLAGLVGGLVTNAMRQAGMQRVDDLVTYAVLHPEIARTLLAKAAPDVKSPIIGKLIRQLGNVTAASPLVMETRQRRSASR